LDGGLARSPEVLHRLARATADVDLFVRPDAANVERLKDALRAVFADPSINEISAADLWAGACRGEELGVRRTSHVQEA
jgi:hypothetical protein